MQQSCCQNTLQKSAIQRLHVEKCGVQNKRLAVYPWPAANESSTELSAINWNKERKQFDREHFTIAQIEVLKSHEGTKISSSYGNFATVSSASGGLVGRTGKAKVLVAQSPTPVYFAHKINQAKAAKRIDPAAAAFAKRK